MVFTNRASGRLSIVRETTGRNKRRKGECVYKESEKEAAHVQGKVSAGLTGSLMRRVRKKWDR